MANLILPSLEIQNFRAFEHLRIERLGRVNLITGKNNVGKTSLLEALYLYARGGSPYQLLEILDIRDEMHRHTRTQTAEKSLENAAESLNIKHLFYGRKEVFDQTQPIQIGPLGSKKDVLAISVLMKEVPSYEEYPAPTSSPRPIYESSIADYDAHEDNPENTMGKLYEPYLIIRSRKGVTYNFPIERLLDKNYNPYLTSPDTIHSPYVKTSGWQTSALSQTYDKVALKPEEDDVLNALRIIDPQIERVGFVGEEGGERKRVPIVRMRNMDAPVPLRSLGEGMYRLFGIALALTAARDGILLIDEVETGLHYSVMPEVWKLIFQVAERLNVQVFATTHSWDCIEAFQQAAAEDHHEEALLIRLREKNGKVATTIFDERDLAIVTRELIEVR